MTSRRLIPATETRIEFQVSNSTFIAFAAPAFSVEEAKQFIDHIRETTSDATHHVPVYIIGHPPTTIEHSNDDGEPPGTAGRPALSVLRGSGLGDIVIVIVRYFGGTKLGTGGLVRAYSDAVREVLQVLPRAQKVSTVSTKVEIPYSLYDQVERLVKNSKGQITQQDFGVQVSLNVRFTNDEFPEFRDRLIEISNGQILAEISDTNPNTIFPV